MQIETPVSDALYYKVKYQLIGTFNPLEATPEEIVAVQNMLQLEEAKYAINRVLETLGLMPQDEPWIEYNFAALLTHVGQIQESLESLVEQVGLVPSDVYKNPLIALDGIRKRWEETI